MPHTGVNNVHKGDSTVQRWQVGTYLRHLKQTMGLDVLHCQRWTGVMKGLTVFALVYNLERVVMLAAAQRQGVALERISFIDAVRRLSPTRPGDPLPPLVAQPSRSSFLRLCARLAPPSATMTSPVR